MLPLVMHALMMENVLQQEQFAIHVLDNVSMSPPLKHAVAMKNVLQKEQFAIQMLDNVSVVVILVLHAVENQTVLLQM